jgi:hypothetical protein
MFYLATLTAITKPKVCSKIVSVFDFGVYKKSLCYVKMEATYFKASNFCLKNGMKLYQTQSSASTSVLSIFTSKYFGGSRKAEAFVEGKTGKKCKTFSGIGKTNFAMCQSSYTFFCEFIDTGNYFCSHFMFFLDVFVVRLFVCVCVCPTVITITQFFYSTAGLGMVPKSFRA